jgi:hypothetical protein
MAKKSRRTRRKQTVQRSRVSPSSAFQVEKASAPSRPAETSSASNQVDFSAEYRYVITDLRSMAIIAVAMLAVLVALSYVIR